MASHWKWQQTSTARFGEPQPPPNAVLSWMFWQQIFFFCDVSYEKEKNGQQTALGGTACVGGGANGCVGKGTGDIG